MLPGADAHPALRVRALCIEGLGCGRSGAVADQAAVTATAEAEARALADPTILSEVLQARALQALHDNRHDLAGALADEALRCAEAAADDWSAAIAEHTRAIAATSAADLREHVDRAASLLEAVGNVYFLADLLASAAYGALCYGSDGDAMDFVKRATPITRALDDPYSWMLLCGNTGLAALLTGDAGHAAEAFRQELTLSRDLVVLPFACEGLNGLAAVAVLGQDLPRAARLTGAAAAHRYGQPEDRIDARLHARFLQPARTRFGGDRWDAAVREGAALRFHDAIALALEEPQPLEADRGAMAPSANAPIGPGSA